MKEALSLDTIENLKVIDVTFTKAIATGDRGFCSQILMSQLRNLIERVMFLCVFKGKDADKDFSYQNIENAISVARSRGELRFLYRFHDFVKISASHYTLDEDKSERLMLKYYDFVIAIKIF